MKFQEAAILKETDVFKKMLKQADLCQAKTHAKRTKHANIKWAHLFAYHLSALTLLHTQWYLCSPSNSWPYTDGLYIALSRDC